MSTSGETCAIPAFTTTPSSPPNPPDDPPEPLRDRILIGNIQGGTENTIAAEPVRKLLHCGVKRCAGKIRGSHLASRFEKRGADAHADGACRPSHQDDRPGNGIAGARFHLCTLVCPELHVEPVLIRKRYILTAGFVNRPLDGKPLSMISAAMAASSSFSPMQMQPIPE